MVDNQDKNEEFFSELINKRPIFALGFSQDKLFYDDSTEKLTKRGAYFQKGADLNYIKSQQVNQPSSVGKNYYSRLAKKMESNEIPQGDFVYMSGMMAPNNKVYTAFSGDEVAEMGTLSGAVPVRDLLDRSSELGMHLEEFIHRALRVVPELNEWKKQTLSSSNQEEILMGAIISKYFPDLTQYENDRIKRTYKADLSNEYNKKLSNKWISEIEAISNNILKNKKVKIKPKPKPKPDSIMDKPKIEPKPKPKPDEKEKTWMEFIKNLFN